MRRFDAGVTLVEVLVVLVLIGIMAGAVGLSLGPADRGDAVDREATLLTARLNRAADEALLSGRDLAFVRDADGYRFEVREGMDWVPHPLALLARPHAVSGAALDDGGVPEGRYVVAGDLIPAEGQPLTLVLRGGGGYAVDVTFDGVNATQAPVQ